MVAVRLLTRAVQRKLSLKIFLMSVWKCGRFELPLGDKTYVMGIVNATPDSFSGDGVLREAAISHARRLIDEGADILDIGGESTRPGAAKISVAEELERVIPVIETLAREIEIPISVDTTKAEVARHALNAGASIINDISGATFDDAMLGVLGPRDCGVVLMHLRGTPQAMKWSTRVEENNEAPDDLISEITLFWRERIGAANLAGIENHRICLDAGFGFGKSLGENLEILRRGRELKNFDTNGSFPILSGTSRKSTIGRVLSVANQTAGSSGRIWGTAATVAVAIQNGADLIRVHDVREMSQVARMTDAIARPIIKPKVR